MRRVTIPLLTCLLCLSAASGQRLIPDNFPTAETTGIAGVGLTLDDLTYVGHYKAQTDDEVIYRKILQGVEIEADNVTLRECYIDQGWGIGIKNYIGKPGLLIEDCTLVGNGEAVGVAGPFTMRRCDISGYEDGVNVKGTVVMEDCYVHDLYKYLKEFDNDPPDWTHNDCNQFANEGGADLIDSVFRHNTFLGVWQHSTSAIIMGANPDNTLDNNAFVDNFLSGGSYCVYYYNNGGTGPINSEISRNIWEDGSWSVGAIKPETLLRDTEFVCNFDDDGDPMSFNSSSNPVATPEISPLGAHFTGNQTVTITCDTPGAEIRYTTDHSDVTSSSTLYTGSFTLSASAHVKARAFKTGMDDSLLGFAAFRYYSGGNIPPIADAGPRQVIVDSDRSGAESVDLDGSGSVDRDGSIASYVWEEDSTLIDTGATPTVTLDVGVHTIDLTVTDDDAASDTDSVVVEVRYEENYGTFQQDSGSDGLVSMQAENYYQRVAGGGDAWEFSCASTDASGGVAMRAGPDNGTYRDSASVANSPRLDFKVNFVKTGTHYVWVRCYAEDSSSDSCHVGLNGSVSSSYAFGRPPVDFWRWESRKRDTYMTRSTINVPSTGVHTFNLWMCEDGFRVDQIILTTDSDPDKYSTDGGKAESTWVVDTLPVARAGADQEVTDLDNDGTEPIDLDGSGSFDPDGSIVGYLWEEDSTTLATVAAPTLTLDTTVHTLDLTVTDDDTNTDTDSVVVTVNPFPGTMHTIDAHANDQTVKSNGTFRGVAESTHRVGGGDGAINDAAVLPFQLPALTAGEEIVNADFTIKLNYIANSPSGAVDLYGLRYRAASTVQSSDYYLGGYDGDTTEGCRALQNDFATPSTSSGTLSIDTDAKAALTAYIKDQYDDGAAAGDYVFLRLSPDSVAGYYCYWVFTSADGSPKPALTIVTTVPPTADAGADQEVNDHDESGDAEATLDGSASYDTDGDLVDYVWTENSTQIDTGVSPTVTLTVGQHTIDLTVTDDVGGTDTDSVVVTVTPYVNVPPTADAGEDFEVTDYDDGGDEAATLNGFGSDSDGYVVSYLWEEDSAQIANVVSPTVTLDVGVHTIDLTVTDDDSDTGSDSVVVTVNPKPFPGTIYTLNASTDDLVVKSDGSFEGAASGDLRVGRSGGYDGAAILPFALPTLATGQVILEADFEIKLGWISNSPSGNVDLYGLRYRGSSSVQAGDYYLGAYGGDSTDAWALQNNFATPSTSSGVLSPDTAAKAALQSYLEDQYADSAQSGDYAFLRLNPDAAEYNYFYWNFRSADSTTKPVLTITTTMAPVADAGVDQEVDDTDDSGDEYVTLDGSYSSDSDGEIVSYVWEEDAAVIATGATPGVTRDVGEHTIVLTVTDDAGATDTDSVVVTVNSASPFVLLQSGSVSAYDYQDGQNSLPTSAAVTNGGVDITLEGNAWKLHPYSYTVTGDTVVQFTVNASDAGEILGLVLENNTTCLDTRNGFRFGGADVNLDHDAWSWKLDTIYSAGSGDLTYFIPVGEYFTGSCNYLGFIADDDDDGSTDVTFSEIKIGQCAPLEFDDYDLVAYGSVQDGQDSSYTYGEVSLDGLEVALEGNAWKLHPLSATIYSDTVLVFTVNASDAGEIIGVALDDDTDPTYGQRAFVIGGTQYSNTGDWRWTFPHPSTGQPYSAGGGAKTYVIPVGQYFTGTVNYIGFIADDDADASTDVTFYDIRLF